MKELTREEAIQRVSGMIEIAELVRDIYYLEDGKLTADEIIEMIDNHISKFSKEFTPPLIVEC